jgi:hypothetical protein
MPSDLRSMPLAEISAEDLTAALVDSPLRPANVVVLRAFLSQIFERASAIGGLVGPNHDEVSELFWKRWREKRDVQYPELRNLPRQTYLDIFHKLEEERVRWQQALAIRLYFEFRAPLTVILSARWTQIIHHRWYPYTPEQRTYWHAYREYIEARHEELLKRVRVLGFQQFEDSDYWFPSKAGKKAEHIRTVDSMWRDTLHCLGLQYYPIREFSRSYRELNCPSQYMGFMRQYSEIFEQMEIEAKLSKSRKLV